MSTTPKKLFKTLFVIRFAIEKFMATKLLECIIVSFKLLEKTGLLKTTTLLLI